MKIPVAVKPCHNGHNDMKARHKCAIQTKDDIRSEPARNSKFSMRFPLSNATINSFAMYE